MNFGAFARKRANKTEHKYELLNSFLGGQFMVALKNWRCYQVLIGPVA